MRFFHWFTAAAVLVPFAPTTPALAQQALPEFLQAARERALDGREARAALSQVRSQVAEARGRLLPSLVGQGSYQRNSPEVSVTVPTGMVDAMGAPITRQAVITPADQFSAVATATVPLIDLSAWAGLAAAQAGADAAEANGEWVAENVSIAVVELWYRLVGQRALVRAAEQNLAATQQSRDAVAAQVEVGVSGQLELSRAQAELSRAKQALAAAELQATLSARSLEDLTGLTPDPQVAELPMEPGPAQPPLERLSELAKDRPGVRAARAQAAAADSADDAARLALLPTVAANGAARWTNAAGFGRKDSYYVGLSATWALDFVKPARIGTAAAALEGASVRAERAEQQARTAIYTAYQQVETSRTNVDAALSAQAASERAVQDAKARYETGAATQLDLIQAQRDAFQARVAVIQAVATLHVARAVLDVRRGQTTQP